MNGAASDGRDQSATPKRQGNASSVSPSAAIRPPGRPPCCSAASPARASAVQPMTTVGGLPCMATAKAPSANPMTRCGAARRAHPTPRRSEVHTSELQSLTNLVCRLLLEKKKINKRRTVHIDEHVNVTRQDR